MTTKTLDLPAVGEPILTLKAVNKSYGTKRAAQDVNLSIPRGAIYGFLGPNGAGKTTTIRAIMKILLPDSGEIRLGGQLLDGSMRDRIGYLPEERGLYRKMKCVEQLAYLAELKGVRRGEAIVRADHWLERLGLMEYRDRKVDALSKGMQQKIQFAATFIAKPDLVILDEVFSGLDPLNIELLREMILAEKENGTTVIFSTHMLAEAEKICDAICLIEGGEVILDGTMDEVRDRFPLESVRVAWEGGAEPPAQLAGVIHREFVEGRWQLTLAADTDPRSLLPALMEAGELTLFSANRPSLNEIFLTAVARHREEREERQERPEVQA
ncbi:MAG: ATP-binding cassette domain-containing protein [Candidatus Krumholzibacteria bacterium]|nr:ATP-binding cassette domain-containing protein [Candidatus Krumholzibacteria bacterium]